MKIEKIVFTNFRCFGPDSVTLNLEEEVTALVGNNGAGKTAAFMALARLFGTSTAQRTLRKADFHVSPRQAALPSGSVLSIDCVLSFPELEEDAEDADDDAVPEAFSHMATGGEDEPLKVRMRLEASWVDDGTPEGIIEDSFRWIRTLDDDFDWEDCKPVQAVERNFIQLVYVPASRNAADQVTNLLKGRLWRAAKWSQTLATSATQKAGQIQEGFDAEAPTRFILDRLQRRWSQVHQGDTDRQPKLRLIEATLEELVRRAEFVFYPDEAGQSRRLEDLSDGQRSLFHISLTAATLEIEQHALENATPTSPFEQERLKRTYLTLLAIEEPENSLSPFFLSRIMEQAREIGDLATAQVLVSSHSASILSRIEPEEVRYLRSQERTRSSTIRPLTLPPAASQARRYVRLAVRAYPELYFARFVILAEGESEAVILPRLAEAMSIPLDRSFVPIVPLGGRFVTHFWRLLSDLDIPYATLLDLDLGRQHGGSTLIASIVSELAEIGNDLSDNRLVQEEVIDLDEIDDIDDADILAEDQGHPWLKALRLEGVYFSSPLDIDFAMLRLFNTAYQHNKSGGRGPRTTAEAIEEKKATTLKTGGNPDLYDEDWNDEFIWYPYLFLSESKPDAHLDALTRISKAELATRAPEELRKLLQRVKGILEG